MQGPTTKKGSQIPAFRRRVAEQMADYRQRLAERLIHERERKSYSQDTLALAADVSPKTVKRIEEQKVDKPRPVTIRRLAEALDIDPDKLRPPEELEEEQLNRIEGKLDRLLTAAGLDPDADEVGEGIVQAAEGVVLEPAPGDPSQSETGRRDSSEAARRRAAS